jgi:hypothetical protein
MLGVNQPVIGRVGLVEHRKAARMVAPRKASGIDDRAAQRSAVPAEEFGQRVDDDIGAVFDRTQQDRCRHRIVDHQRHAVPCRDLRQRRNIADVAGRIADALAEYRTRVVVDQLFESRLRYRFRRSGR